MCKRLVIFVFYDKAGILDDYVSECVRSLCREVGPVIFVINGLLKPQGRAKIIPYVYRILQRENKGLDTWAFKETLESVGYQNLADYDEIILMNDTCFGPLYPWTQLFTKMADRPELDFWGITSSSIPLNFLINEKRLEGRHIDSYFTVFRRKVLEDPSFHNYWQTLPEIHNYDQAVNSHEQRICEYLARRGFRWGTTCTITEGRDQVFFSPDRLIREQQCPLLKRRCFTHPIFLDYLRYGKKDSIYQTLNYIENHLDYDTQLIWRHILRFTEEEIVMRNLGVVNNSGHPLLEEPRINLSELPRVKVKLSGKEQRSLAAWRISKIIKAVIKILSYPFLRKYLLKQRHQI